MEKSLEQIAAKIDRLYGEFENLKAEISESGLKLPKAILISTAELASYVNVSDRTVVRWIKSGKFHESIVHKRKRGQGYFYRLKSAPAIKRAEELALGVE